MRYYGKRHALTAGRFPGDPVPGVLGDTLNLTTCRLLMENGTGWAVTWRLTLNECCALSRFAALWKLG